MDIKDVKVDRKIVMLVTAVGAFITPFLSSSVVVGLPSIAHEFSMSSVLLNWVATAYVLAAAIFVVPFGRLADIYGRRRIYFFGILLLTAASILCGISFSPEMLIFSRILQGIGSAMMFGTGVAMLTSVYGAGERGRALGINVAFTYLGLTAGPFLGGILTKQAGWRSIFFSVALLGLAALVTVLVKLRYEWTEVVKEKFDLYGTLIYAIALLGIMLGLSTMENIWLGTLLTLTGIIALVLFVFYESRAKSPVLNIALFKDNRVLLFSALAALINYSATNAISYLLSLYLQYIKAFDPQLTGIFLIAQPAMQVLFSPFAGRVSDRIEPQKVASIGMGITTAGLLLFVFLSEGSDIFFIITGLLLLGFGFALFSSPNTNAMMSSVDKRFYGIASGLMGTARLVGQTLSMAITALVFSIYMGSTQIAQADHADFILSVKSVFIIFTLLCFAGIFASYARGSIHGRRNKK
jgi:EmrB/QacA subfamily drug resistance transporter